MVQQQSLRRRARKRLAYTAIFLFALILAAFLNLLTGPDGFNIGDIGNLIQHKVRFIIVMEQIRLPRAVAGILAGALLGLSGAIMQGSLKNPLASPYTLGISQAAAFGASFAIIILQAYSAKSSIGSNIGVGACAFLSSLICMITILILGKISSLSPGSMVLAGVGLGSLFHALTMFLQYFASDLEVSATLFWTFGELGKASWENIYIMAFIFIPIYIYFIFSHWKMDALSFGDDNAQSRGVEVDRFRFISLLLSSLLSAIAVSFLGIIGFVGLIASHIVRMLVGSSHLSIILLSPIVGSILVLLADFVSKIIIKPVILPIGILTSFMGVPLFLYLLLSKAK
ncbi:FecCD family ABC transporter permease [Hippea sp. KM1]|uniref:FecCD family ABC transporter permease n=1 Tax=Hippea sp. KM1 TaxID=944481 RepID=UPI00046CABD3|nr:iron ABC transporter permease [Hippea sp. KM1]